MKSQAAILGRGTWLDQLAHRIIQREQRLGRSLDLLRVESGLAASGIPHIGNLSDAVRAFGVRMALEDMGYRAEFTSFEDDLDGLRSVPAGFPSWLQEHLARPVSLIPDPFDCHPSYGEHSTALLREALDTLGITYRRVRAYDAYRNGMLAPQIERILTNADRIGRHIAKTLGQTKFEAALPYFPLCQECKRVYLAEAFEYLPAERKVRYRCRGSEIHGQYLAGCGHEGEVGIEVGQGKLNWKVEFAARWAAQDIRFEAYGKELEDSVKLNDWISDEILSFPHPTHVRYEHFLLEGGKKMSKSVGSVFTPQTWLRYGTPESLYLLMFKRIRGARPIGLNDIPKYMDEYDWLEDTYFGPVAEPNRMRRAKLSGLYQYVHRLQPPKQANPHVPYTLLVQLAAVAPPDRPVDYIAQKLVSYGTVRSAPPSLRRKIELALNWAQDFAATQPRVVQLSTTEQSAVLELARLLRRERDPQVVQSEIFETAKRHGLEPRQFFRTLYQILLGREQGPRLGPYLVDIGAERSAQLLEQAGRNSPLS